MNTKLALIGAGVLFVVVAVLVGYSYYALAPHSFTTTLTQAGQGAQPGAIIAGGGKAT